MLPRKNRIRRGRFKELSNGAALHSKHLMLVAYEGGLGDDPMFAFSVSKKVSKSAVGRNRARRRGYSAISRLIPGVRKGFLGHFSAKKGLETISFNDVFDEVRGLLRRASALGHYVEEGVKIR